MRAAAARIARVSAWAVGSPRLSRAFWPRPITSPVASTMTQPTGTSPAAAAASASARATRIWATSSSMDSWPSASSRGRRIRANESTATAGPGGAPRKIRTSDTWFRRPVLYPAELWAPSLDGGADDTRGRRPVKGALPILANIAGVERDRDSSAPPSSNYSWGAYHKPNRFYALASFDDPVGPRGTGA